MRNASRRGRHALEQGRRPSLGRSLRAQLDRGLSGNSASSRFRLRPAQVAASAAAILIGVLGAAGTAAGSMAYLNSTAQVGTASTVSAGEGSLTLQSGSDPAGTSIVLPAAVWDGMLPGDIAGQTITVANTGDTTLAMSSRLSVTIDWEIRVATGSCPVGQIPGAALSTTSTAWTTIAAGDNETLCIQAVLPNSAPASAQGSNPVVSLIVDGVQVT